MSCLIRHGKIHFKYGKQHLIAAQIRKDREKGKISLFSLLGLAAEIVYPVAPVTEDSLADNRSVFFEFPRWTEDQ